MREPAQRQRIPLGPEPRDHAVGAQRNVGVVPEFLALVDVRNMDFDNRAFERVERVENGDRRMSECGRIDHDTGRVFPRLVDPVDDLILAVRLMKSDLKPEFSGNLAAIGLDIGKRFMTVDVGLALAKQIEIGAVQYVNDAAHFWVLSLMSIFRPASCRLSATAA